jgi:hypothetical protein
VSCALLFALPLLAAVAGAAELVTVEERGVVAWPEQALRAEPRPGAELVAWVPFGQTVTVRLSAERGPVDAVAGLEGRWARVRAGGSEGWMFDAWLVALPAPPADCEGLESWVARWEPQGSELVRRFHSHDHQIWTQREQAYQGGMKVVRSNSAGAPKASTWLPDTGPAQAWFVARRCHPGLKPLAEAGWPPRSGAGFTVQRRGEVVEIVDEDGAAILALMPEPGGVWLAWR